MRRDIIKIAFCCMLFCILLIGGGYGFWRYEPKIHNKITKIKKDHQRRKEYRFMHEKRVDIDTLSALSDESEAWYTLYHIVSHAGGGIDGRTYTNSKDAWDYAYSRGNRVMDADLTFTSDRRIVLLHDWGDNLEQGASPMNTSSINEDRNGHIQRKSSTREKLDFDTFMSRKIFRKYTPMSCEMMLCYMQAHPDLYVATDTHLDDVVETYQYVVDKAREMGLDSVLTRIIANVYDYDTYDKIMEVYPFVFVTARQHYVHPNNYYELADFCVRNGIHVVNVSSCYMGDEGIHLLTEKGIHIITAVVDYLSDMHEYRKQGSDGCVSNFLYEDIYHLSDEQ